MRSKYLLIIELHQVCASCSTEKAFSERTRIKSIFRMCCAQENFTELVIFELEHYVLQSIHFDDMI